MTAFQMFFFAGFAFAAALSFGLVARTYHFGRSLQAARVAKVGRALRARRLNTVCRGLPPLPVRMPLVYLAAMLRTTRKRALPLIIRS